MNRLQLETIRKSNFHKLDTAFRPKKNAVELDINNSMEHNLALTICQILIRKGFPASQLQVVIDKIIYICMKESMFAASRIKAQP